MSTSQLEKFQDEVVIPEGITVTQKKHMLTFVGPLGKTHKSFRLIPVKIEITEDKLEYEIWIIPVLVIIGILIFLKKRRPITA